MADHDEYRERAKQLAEKEKKMQPDKPIEQIGHFKGKRRKKSNSIK